MLYLAHCQILHYHLHHNGHQLQRGHLPPHKQHLHDNDDFQGFHDEHQLVGLCSLQLSSGELKPSIFFLGLVINKVIIWEVLENNHHYHFRPKVPPPSLLKQHRYRHHHYDRRQGVQNQSQRIVL